MATKDGGCARADGLACALAPVRWQQSGSQIDGASYYTFTMPSYRWPSRRVPHPAWSFVHHSFRVQPVMVAALKLAAARHNRSMAKEMAEILHATLAPFVIEAARDLGVPPMPTSRVL